MTKGEITMVIKFVSNGFSNHERMLKERLEERIPVVFADGEMTIELLVDNSIATPESYIIEETSENYWKISGSEEQGLYFGIGKFLHSAKWDADKIVPRGTNGVSSPDCSFRAIYVCNHLSNFYEKAPLDVLSRYLEDLMLWGYNTIHGILPVVGYDSPEDEGFKKATEHLRNVFKLGKKLGMKNSFAIVPNQAFLGAPREYANDPSFDHRVCGNGGNNVCLSKPDAWKYMENVWSSLMESFLDIGLDYVLTWPYDEGGCGCEGCRTWGNNMFCTSSKAIHEMAKEMYPDVKSILSTWCFDAPEDRGEYAGLYERLQGDMDYLDYLMVDSHNNYPAYVLEHELIKPVVNFPEVSMWGLYPWGGFGANPLLERFERIWNMSKQVLKGGAPYSEGIYEDISKVQFAGYYWDKEATYKDIMREYVSYEFDESVYDNVIEMMLLIEKNHAGITRRITPLPETYIRAKELAEKINSSLSERAKKCWRWRILYIRAILDYKRYSKFFSTEHADPEELLEVQLWSANMLVDDKESQELFQELFDLYYAVPFNERNCWTLPPVGGTKFAKSSPFRKYCVDTSRPDFDPMVGLEDSDEPIL